MYEQFLTILEEIRGSWRFRRSALALAWFICLVGWAVVWMLPDMYQSSARIFVDTRTPLGGYLKDLTIQPDVTAQLNLVRQSILSRPVLEKVIRETDLDLRVKTPAERLALIEKLQQKIHVGASDSGHAGIVFTVQYRDSSRETSLKVVQLLMNTFVEDTLGGKRTGSEVAQKFLREQIEEYEQRLREAEERLADFKRRNVGLMPGAQGDYFSRLQTESAAVEKLQGELSIALTAREELERQLRGEAVIAATQVASGPNGANGGDINSRIREAQTKLDNLLLQYTEKHPDVIALRETIKQLEERRRAEIEALKQGGTKLPAGAAASPVVQSIQLAINKSDLEIASLKARIADGQRRIAELRRLVNTAPEVEAEFARLNRDYDATRKRHLELLDRAERAKLGDQAEETEAARFEVIDPPAATFEPVGPKRPVLFTLVLLIGLGAGGALAFVLHQLKPVFTNSRVLAEVTSLPVLGVVSKTWLDKHRLQRRFELIRYSAAAGALALLYILVLAYSGTSAQSMHFVLG